MKTKYISLLVGSLLLLNACNDIGVFEQQKFFEKQAWDVATQPEFSFTIKDTAALYNIFIAVRHTDAYRYNNIWVEITTQSPGDTAKVQSLNLLLADNKKGWLGTGMDDIFDHRIRITKTAQKLKAGQYKFKLKQIMRENPLPAVLNAGVRIEKAVS
jgi:gliding motility-associated lipoprotein GldH